MILRIAAAVIGVLCLLPSAAFAAGFDCAKASSAVEKLICSDSRLSKADEELSDLYSRALAGSGKKAEFKKEQMVWIRTERDRCRDKDCLAAEYKKRIEVLSGPSPIEEYYMRERFPNTGEEQEDDEEESGDKKPEGLYYHVCVKVHGNPSAPLVDFEIYFPDSGQSVTAELVRCKTAGEGTLEFTFMDNWGNKGKGRLDRSGEEATLNVEEVKAIEPGWGRNALRNYGEYELTRQKCGSGEE